MSLNKLLNVSGARAFASVIGHSQCARAAETKHHSRDVTQTFISSQFRRPGARDQGVGRSVVTGHLLATLSLCPHVVFLCLGLCCNFLFLLPKSSSHTRSGPTHLTWYNLSPR